MGQLEISNSGVQGELGDSALLLIYTMHLQYDYRLIIPNIRGFGASTHPGDVQSSGSMPDLVGDVMCILQHASVSKAVVIGQVSFLASVVSNS